MKKIIILSFIIGLLAYLTYFGIQKRFYRTISQETLVGVIKCARSTDKNYDFYLFYIPGPKGDPSNFRFVKLKGNEWFFEGEIVKWKGFLNLLGFKTAQRPVRIYDSAGTSYLLEAGPKKIMFGIKKILPVVDTSFISIVKQRFIPKTKFGIYATNTGYLLRRIR